MASPICLLLLLAFTARASAATFTITNNCSFTMWPAAATPIGGGVQLNPGQTWTLDVPVGTSGRIWGRTGCSFNGSSSSGHCTTGDCAGMLSCRVSGQPPATLAEFSIGGAQDLYDIAVVDGYNLAMAFSCSAGVGLVCRDPTCLDAFPNNPDGGRIIRCPGNSNYQVTYCP